MKIPLDMIVEYPLLNSLQGVIWVFGATGSTVFINRLMVMIIKRTLAYININGIHWQIANEVI